jgi:formate--tetrahydrofolate ligase
MIRDYKINKQANLKSIGEIAAKIGLTEDDIVRYGDYKAKIRLPAINKLKPKLDSRLILVTAITPTKFGEGKSTVTIGLGDALSILNKKAIITLREPSLGPCFGIKGGATGGGYTQVAPMDDINLHFNGDFHAITAANNLLASMIDNHIYHGNELQIDAGAIGFHRCLDLNDRALRSVTIGRKDKKYTPRDDSFDITVASEIMAVFCLSRNIAELDARLSDIIVAKNAKGENIYARDLKAVGAMKALLKDAFAPNLVQSLEHTPAIIHGGPFANIAHGCNSIIATETALKLADYVVTEAGFAADLGAEKFMDIKCREFGLKPSAVVIVATAQGLKLNGFENLQVHIDNIKKFGIDPVIAINKADVDNDIGGIIDIANRNNVEYAVSSGFTQGGEGCVDLADKVIRACEKPVDFKFIYDTNESIPNKIGALAKEIYRSSKVEYSDAALQKLEQIKGTKAEKYAICTAKTQNSITDDADIKGDPSTQNYTFHVRDIRVSNGAKFIVAIAGSIMTMPGLPKVPTAEIFDIDDEGNLTGGFDKAGV